MSTIVSVTPPIILSLVMAAMSLTTGAQSYPNRPIRFISPYPPGGGNDTIARILGDRLGEQLGQRVIVDNRPGANTIVGTELAAKALPDGHTIILLANTFVTNPGFYAKLPYDAMTDFAAVGEVAISPQMLVAHPAFPAGSVNELIALAKAKPAFYTYASAGNGSPGHFAGLLFDMMTGARLVHVAYKGTAPAVTELLGGHVLLMFASMLPALQYVKAGKLRLIAVTTAKRSTAIPDAPTIGESGVPGYEASLWYGILAPARTPQPIIRRLSTEFANVLKQPEVVERLSSQGVEPHATTPEQFAAVIKAEIPKWAKVIAVAGVRSE